MGKFHLALASGLGLILLTLFLSIECLVDSNKSPYDQVILNDIESFPTAESTSFRKSHVAPYTPTWASLDARPLPSWYDKAKVGVFMHWGVFSVPGFKTEWFWWNLQGAKDPATVEFMKENYSPKFTYQDFGREFTAEFYNPTHWAEILKKSGAKYAVLTSKHHDGYTLWPSKYSFGWNTNVGSNRDLLGELATAIRNTTNIRFGIYHSWFEWFNPLYLHDKANGFNSSVFVTQKSYPEFQELVEKYQPEVIWSDGDWEASDDYWKSKEFLAWLYNSSPVKDTVVVNDRWGKGTSCKHGGFFSCADHYNPGHILPYKWENAMTIDKNSWGFRRNADLQDYRTPQELLFELVSTVSCGGNFLINIGPTKDGMIAPILEERLLQMGKWLGVNGHAIYESVPWKVAQNDSMTKGVWYTTKPGEKQIFAVILEEAWPEAEEGDDKARIMLGSVDSKTVRIKNISMLGLKAGRILPWKPCPCVESESNCMEGILVTLPNIRPVDSEWAWTLVINY